MGIFDAVEAPHHQNDEMAIVTVPIDKGRGVMIASGYTKDFCMREREGPSNCCASAPCLQKSLVYPRECEGLIFGGKSCILDSGSYKRTIDWFSFFVSICSLPPGILSPLFFSALPVAADLLVCNCRISQ